MNKFDLKKYMAENHIHKIQLTEDYTTPELGKASDVVSSAIQALRKASVARGFWKGNDAFTALEKAWSILDNDLQSKDIRAEGKINK